MSNNKAIQIILRIRPVPNRFEGIKVDQQNNQITFSTPKDENQGYINNQKESVKFKFDQIFDMDAPQQKIFDKVAKDVADKAIEGFNGTIFAYGQTGSGKTYTMTGGGEVADGQGIIPRIIRHVYFIAAAKSIQIKVVIRYLQIYNGVGYDLLDPKIDSQDVDKVKKLQELQKVKPMESGNGDLVLQNLSQHYARTHQDAMDLFIFGDTNRITCKTPKNDESTRSHCIFMINLQTSRPGTEIKSQSTINLVDLSGSQRIKQTGVEGLMQKQAISINLGLHYLERMIVELNKKMNGQNVHIPYRQSLMNLILRDSIGGNCITRMIATMSPKKQDVMETIATCRFAQRVALIKNTVQRNETVDPQIIIARLKRQNEQLKAELALLKGQNPKTELDKWDEQQCQKAVDDYIQSNDPSEVMIGKIMSQKMKIDFCFSYFKRILKKGGGRSINIGSQNKNQSNLQKAKGGESGNDQKYQDEIKRLKIALQSRDNEIALLLSLINKKRGGNALQSLPLNRLKPQQEQIMKSIIHEKPLEFPQEQKLIREEQKRQQQKLIEKSMVKKNNWMTQTQNSTIQQNKSVGKSSVDVKQIQNMLIKPLNLTNQDLLDEAKAFEAFRVSSRKNQALQKNTQILKEKMRIGKQVATIVHQSRQKVGRLKNRLEQLQRENVVKNIVDNVDRDDPEEQAIRQQMVRTKKQYQEASLKLKAIKSEVQNLQILLKKNKDQMEKDFLKYVLYKQQEREKTTSVVDSSLLASNIRDKEVQKHLQSFLKARDELRKK